MTKLDEAIDRKGRPLVGLAVHHNNPAFVEIAAHLGCDALWIEMEHGHVTFRDAVELCRLASALGMVTMVRIPDSRRENVLKACECGPDMIDLPMSNSVEVVEELVRHGRYAPEGARGYFGGSRALDYGIHPIAAAQQRINQELCLLAQIETRQAVENADAICSVPGINGILIGPGDMSASFGVPDQITHPDVTAAIETAVKTAKRHGLRVTLACPASWVATWAPKGVDVFWCGGDVGSMRIGAKTLLDQAFGALG